MTSRLRRFLVLTTLPALLLGVSGAVAVSSLAANPPNTKVAGIDVDATSIPKLQQFMNSHRMNSVELTNFYLRRIRQLNPHAQRGDHGQPDGPRGRASGRRSATQGRPSSPARDSDHRQGQHRHCRHADDSRLVGARREHARRRVHCAEAEDRRGDHHRQGESLRMGQLPVRPSSSAGAASVARPTCPTSSIATRAARAPAPASPRLPISRSQPSARRRTARSSARPAPTATSDQADTRAVEPRGRRADQRQSRHGRPDRPQRDRRCGTPRRGDRCRRERRLDRRSGRACVYRLHAVPQRSRPPGQADRRLARRHV